MYVLNNDNGYGMIYITMIAHGHKMIVKPLFNDNNSQILDDVSSVSKYIFFIINMYSIMS